jgi:hypothetical protein
MGKHIDGSKGIEESTHNKLSTQPQRTQSVVLEPVREANIIREIKAHRRLKLKLQTLRQPWAFAQRGGCVNRDCDGIALFP